MKFVFVILRKTDSKFFNKKGEWSDNIMSLQLKEFNTEIDAKAAIPEDTDCMIVKKYKPESDLNCICYLQNLKTNLFLNSNNEFKASLIDSSDIVSFSNYNEAIVKAEQLCINLSLVRVISLPNNWLLNQNIKK